MISLSERLLSKLWPISVRFPNMAKDGPLTFDLDPKWLVDDIVAQTRD